MKDSVAKICSVEDCERKHIAKGYCSGHYYQMQNHGKTWKIKDLIFDQENCDFPECKLSHYSKGYCIVHYKQIARGDLPKKSQNPDAITLECLVEKCERNARTKGLCQTHYKKKRQGLYDWDKNISQIKIIKICIIESCDKPQVAKEMCKTHYALKGKFKLSNERIFELYENPICHICGVLEDLNGKRHPVDHDHSCCPANSGCEKCVRGLLCQSCNHALGFFKDDIALLEKAIQYIKKSHDRMSQYDKSKDF